MLRLGARAAGLLLLIALAPKLFAQDDVFEGGYFIDESVLLTFTPTPTGTKTPTITRTATVTPTPTTFGCQIVPVTGTLVGPDGNPAANRRISITVPTTEPVNAGCTLHPGTAQYRTQADGTMPPEMQVVARSKVNITLENGSPVQVCVPTVASIEINTLLQSHCP